MTMTTNEYRALSMVIESMMDEGTKLDMLSAVENHTREDNTGYSSLTVEDIAEEMGLTVNQVKGVVGSLAKKDLVICDDEDEMILISNNGILKHFIETLNVDI